LAENNEVTAIVYLSNIQKADRAEQQINDKAFAAEIDITGNSSVNSFLQ
jgi:hypothetical protein